MSSNKITSMAAKEAGGALEKHEYDAGELAADFCEVDVEFCGICHSDLSMINNEWGMSSYPLVCGHEAIGKVSRVGSEVKGLTVGTRVGLGWHSSYCNSCRTCVGGDQNLCASAAGSCFTKGGFGNKVRAQSTALIPIPSGLDPSVAGPLMCGGITVFNPFVQFNVSPLSKVAVIGIGGLGHLALQFARAWGCEVTAFTSSERKIKEAKELGAHYTLNSRDPEALKAKAGYFDLIISTVNVKMDWNAYIGTLGPKGRLHLVGAVLEPVDAAVFPLIMQQRCISGSPVGSPTTIAQMLDFCVRHDIKPVVEKMKLTEVNAAIDKLKNGDVHYRLVLENDL